ncbi:histidine--tRNA ligase [Paenibacillus sp. NPDC058071]|uniref:histidine--tRNA ligase n=1 Tax=Paenibacillus sp. NPDC058071 TaxID=3346326 RepID=UPI0036DDF2EA
MQNVKGTADFWGNEQALRRKVQAALRETFELFDYEELESAILNEEELLVSKYTGGEEIVKEMYRFGDQGERQLALRYDLTIPFAKVLALNPGIVLPFRRYEIGKVFRDGPTKRGRMREFTQCDADVAGIAGPEAEAELMQLAATVFEKLSIPVTLRWNNRRLLGELMQAVGVPDDLALSVMLTLDKLAKIGIGGVLEELEAKGLDEGVIRSLSEMAEWLSATEVSIDAVAERYALGDAQGLQEALALQTLLTRLDLDRICRFDPFLSRGLSFYTGTVYEIFDASVAYTSSLGGGGRYDEMIGHLIDREDAAYPTVGLSFGLEPIMELLRERGWAENARPLAAVVPASSGVEAECLAAASAFRAAGIRTRQLTSGRKLKRSLAMLSASGIRFAILIGTDEARAGKVTLKDMIGMTEETVEVEEAIYRIERWSGSEQ